MKSYYKKTIRVLALSIFILFGHVNYLNSIQLPFDDKEAEEQAYDLFKKFDITNTPFIIKKNIGNVIAKNELEINGKGIHLSIIVSRKYWKMLNEAEREFILCHEISHLKRRHYIPTLLSALSTNLLVAIAPLITMNQLDKCNYKAFSNLSAKIFVSILVAGITRSCTSALNAKIDRELEYQADSDALFMTKNLNAGIESLKKRSLILKDDLSFWRSVFADHPTTDDRIKNLNRLASMLNMNKI